MHKVKEVQGTLHLHLRGEQAAGLLLRTWNAGHTQEMLVTRKACLHHTISEILNVAEAQQTRKPQNLYISALTSRKTSCCLSFINKPEFLPKSLFLVKEN